VQELLHGLIERPASAPHEGCCLIGQQQPCLWSTDQVDAARQGVEDLLEEGQARLGARIGLVLSLLGSTPLGDITINLQNSECLALLITEEHLAALNQQRVAITTGVRQFPFPMPRAGKVLFKSGTARGKASGGDGPERAGSSSRRGSRLPGSRRARDWPDHGR
jgi:hypothetical protein